MTGTQEFTERQPDTERQRLAAGRANKVRWDLWGPYLAERQWGTVREDYSATGDAWASFPHDHARSRAYRWGEDGLLGISDDQARLCFALALWNGSDPILKERLFGLTGPEGNHGEDVKEVYYYLDATPTHCYLKALYKYPQRAFPYADLVAENRRRGRDEPEYELLDTGVFAEDRYFDVHRRVRQGGARRHPDPASRPPTAAPSRRRCTCCRRSGSATTGPGVVGDRPAARELCPMPAEDAHAARSRRPTTGWATTGWPAPGNRSCCSPRTRRNAERLWGAPNRDAVRQGRHQRRGRPRRDGRGQSRRGRDRRSRRTTSLDAASPARPRRSCLRLSAIVERRRDQTRSPSAERDVRAPASPRPTRSTRPLGRPGSTTRRS